MFGVAFSVLIAVVGSVSAADHGANFSNYPATVFKGPYRSPSEIAALPNVVEQLSEGVNFAGHFTHVILSCGTACTSDWIVDRRTGQMLRTPVGEPDAEAFEIDTRANSNLMNIVWVTTEHEGSGATRPPCFSQSFVWTGNKLRPLAKRAEITCPKGAIS